ncbi:MAG: hypothetical protein ACOYMN_08010 [Roseimicrobium sp.]
MKAVPSFLLAPCLLALASCANVVSKKAVGDTPAELKAEDWEGTWMTPDKHVVHLRVKDAAKGELEAAWVEEKDEKFVMETHELLIRKHGEWLWANMQGDDGMFLFGRITEADDDRILAWGAHPPGFAEAVRSGKFRGELLKNADGKETGSVRLEALSDADLQALERGEIKDAFAWDHPLVLVRLREEN